MVMSQYYSLINVLLYHHGTIPVHFLSVFLHVSVCLCPSRESGPPPHSSRVPRPALTQRSASLQPQQHLPVSAGHHITHAEPTFTFAFIHSFSRCFKQSLAFLLDSSIF